MTNTRAAGRVSRRRSSSTTTARWRSTAAMTLAMTLWMPCVVVSGQRNQAMRPPTVRAEKTRGEDGERRRRRGTEARIDDERLTVETNGR